MRNSTTAAKGVQLGNTMKLKPMIVSWKCTGPGLWLHFLLELRRDNEVHTLALLPMRHDGVALLAPEAAVAMHVPN